MLILYFFFDIYVIKAGNQLYHIYDRIYKYIFFIENEHSKQKGLLFLYKIQI